VRHSAHRGRLVYAAEHKKSSKEYRRRRSRRKRGQQKIDAQRAREIQEALIREHYLSGKPDGIWGSATQKAMQRYQADNGWQTKTTPDSRALIKLGLGPDHAHLLNPDTAMTGVAEADAKTAADAKQPAKAVSAADAKAKPMVKPAADSEAVAPSAAAPANGDPAPAADSNPAAKPQK
jgi:peptidoglycan hydrolase-like protein with peptidoglycan-binding domain